MCLCNWRFATSKQKSLGLVPSILSHLGRACASEGCKVFLLFILIITKTQQLPLGIVQQNFYFLKRYVIVVSELYKAQLLVRTVCNIMKQKKVIFDFSRGKSFIQIDVRWASLTTSLAFHFAHKTATSFLPRPPRRRSDKAHRAPFVITISLLFIR